MEQRTSTRIPVSLAGFLHLDTEKIPLKVINLSSGGACLAIDPEDFSKFEKSDVLNGAFQHRREEIPFQGTVCWTSTANDITQAGISFKAGQPQLTNLLLHFQPEAEEEPREGQFYI